MSKSNKLKQLSGNLVLGLGGAIFALIVGEIALRIMGIAYPSFYQAAPHRGHAGGGNTKERVGYPLIKMD